MTPSSTRGTARVAGDSHAIKHAAHSIGVLHLIDTLALGGAERMAVNLANQLSGDRIRAHLCTTRSDGLLERDLRPEIPRLRLARKYLLDPFAVLRLVRYMRSNKINILHAHSSSLFIARVASVFAPSVRVIWHDHYGHSQPSDRPAWIYRLAVRNIAGIISVNAALAAWARNQLGVPAGRVWKVNNFVVPIEGSASSPKLPGLPHLRVVCVANMKPEKGHRDLLDAIAKATERLPGLHLLLVGAAPDAAYRAVLDEDIRRLGLEAVVSFLGQREDVHAILPQCSVGVLSSHHEGLPVTLLEYGLAGLGVVATSAGDCAEVLDSGRCGLVVATKQPLALALAIERLLIDDSLRSRLAMRLQRRVSIHYSSQEAIRQLCGIYETALGAQRDVPSSHVLHPLPRDHAQHCHPREQTI